MGCSNTFRPAQISYHIKFGIYPKTPLYPQYIPFNLKDNKKNNSHLVLLERPREPSFGLPSACVLTRMSMLVMLTPFDHKTMMARTMKMMRTRRTIIRTMRTMRTKRS